MTFSNPYQTYQQSSINTASPGELTLMLYNGCLKFLKATRQAIQDNNIEVKNTNIIKAQNIIRELMLTLDMDYEVSHSMYQLYDYMVNQLIQANIKNDLKILEEVENLVVEFRDTWKQVIQINRVQTHGTNVNQPNN
ncbi:flagellar export chaperone FliS [Bacillus horti]|uniref:Flagellar secretion chaperone FliS n=1 Tax=Caldalkalibacillus horti TaxID=77523 RepID=A0ABT9VZB4_9BACI|nr:flagellar export chaperone FliS [Bacillus horti]MDQ0166331.1 flagellar protein FliS [Bacillus horti]